jgi:hypothetical protein
LPGFIKDKDLSGIIEGGAQIEKLLNGPNDLWIAANGGIYFTYPFYKNPGRNIVRCHRIFRVFII